MPGIDQHQKMLFELAEQRRQNGISDRVGTIHQVWSQNGEQKVRVNMGIRQDGTPWLSPWLHTEDHRGAHRQEEKYHKGMNVRLSAVGGDFRQATVSPHGENQAHQRPDHGDEHHHTYQNDKLRERHGLDFNEHWLSDEQDQQDQQTSTTGGAAPTTMQPKKNANKDPDKSVVLMRLGDKPKQQDDTNQPGDGPPTSGGKPKARLLLFAKGGDGKAPVLDADQILIQFGQGASVKLTDKTIALTAATSLTLTVGSSTLTMTPSKITLSATEVFTDAKTYLGTKDEDGVLVKRCDDSCATRVYAK